MDIFAEEGHKVIAVELINGYQQHAALAKSYLVKGEVYTVERTEVNAWHTEVFLKEIPGIAFNSVHFDDVI